MERTLKAVNMTAAGQVSSVRARVGGLVAIGTATAGYVRLYDGTTASDPLIVSIPIAAGVNTVSIGFPGFATFKRGVYLDKSNVGDVSVFIER